MLKYISSCYSYVCEIISKRLEYLQSIDKSRLEQENDYYCRITDGGFVIKKVEEPTVLCPPTAGLPPYDPLPYPYFLLPSGDSAADTKSEGRDERSGLYLAGHRMT